MEGNCNVLLLGHRTDWTLCERRVNEYFLHINTILKRMDLVISSMIKLRLSPTSLTFTRATNAVTMLFN